MLGKSQAEQQPNWQPLSALPVIASHIDEWLIDNRKQLETLVAVEDKPHVLDDETVARVQSVYRNHADDVALFQKQLRRWQQESPSNDQDQEIARLTTTLAEIQTINERILGSSQQRYVKSHRISDIILMCVVFLRFEFS